MECDPAVSVVVVKVAMPEPLSVPVPSAVVPSLKVTVPVGMPAAAVTVAVRRSESPTLMDEDEALREVDVASAVPTDCGLEVLLR